MAKPPQESNQPSEVRASDERRSGGWRELLGAAARYWEPRRIAYNLVLSAVALGWLAGTWPHFRPAFTLASVPPLTVLALLANLCYCAAYFVEIPMQCFAPSGVWQRWRLTIWVLGLLLAILLENYWIGDEIYPDFPSVR